MWQFVTPSRKRIKAGHISARRTRLYRPHCTPLEDRCLLSVSLSGSEPPVPLVGSPVTWTATASGHGQAPVYQFRVGPAGGPSQVVRDFSPSNSFIWDPLQEGSYDIQVTVKDSFGAATGESATASYTADSRVVGSGAVVSPTSNPLVALYSAPPSSGSSMHVEFKPLGSDQPWSSTAELPIVPGESTNFLVAGMLPDTTYLMRHVLDDGTTSAPLTFRTGSLPTNLTFPTFTVQQAPAPGTDLTQDIVFHVGIGGPPGTVDTLATDLMGNIVWYYDPVANAFPSFAPSLVPGGTVLLLGGKLDQRRGREHAPGGRSGRRHPARDERRRRQRRAGRAGAALDHRLQPRRPAPAQRGHGGPGHDPEDHQRQGQTHPVQGRHGPRPGPELPGGVGLGPLQVAERPPPPHAGRGPERLDARQLHRLVAGGREPDRLPALPGLGDQDQLRQRDGRRPRHLAAGAGRRFPDQFHGPIPVVLAPARRALYQRHDAGAVRQREHPPQQEPESE